MVLGNYCLALSAILYEHELLYSTLLVLLVLPLLAKVEAGAGWQWFQLYQNPQENCQLFFQLFFESPCIKNSSDLHVLNIRMLEEFPEEGEQTYRDRQTQHDREYAAAWESAPSEFKQKAATLGLKPDVPETDGMSMDYNDNYSESAHTPDMAKAVDTFVDQIVEDLAVEFRWTPAQCIIYAVIIRVTILRIKKPLEEELARNRANLLGRVSCYLVQDEKGNLRARVHALLHSIPRLAAENGFPSMRSSAKVCGVSPEWLRRKRDSWCDLLEVPRPSNGTKSDEAKLKYRANAMTNHWRNQKFRASLNGNGNKNIHAA